jgi:hypothetical protein
MVPRLDLLGVDEMESVLEIGFSLVPAFTAEIHDVEGIVFGVIRVEAVYGEAAAQAVSAHPHVADGLDDISA